MFQSDVLYYPHIEIRDKSWLKSALLLWDHIYRISPKGYEPNDDEEIRLAVDSDRIRSIELEEPDFKEIADKFNDFLEGLEFLPDGLDEEGVGYIHPGKIDANLYPLLEQYALGESPKGFIKMNREIIRGYMFYLSNKVAERRRLNCCTDDPYSFAVNAYFTENANFGEYICDRNASGIYSAMFINDLLPFEIAKVPMSQILETSMRSKDERVCFRDDLGKFGRCIQDCESDSHAKIMLEDYKNDLIKSKENLKKSQGFLANGMKASLFSVGLPVGLTAFGALVAGGSDPFSINSIGYSLLIGGVAAYTDYMKAVDASRVVRPASYLISMEERFSDGCTFPALDRYMNEFVND